MNDINHNNFLKSNKVIRFITTWQSIAENWLHISNVRDPTSACKALSEYIPPGGINSEFLPFNWLVIISFEYLSLRQPLKLVDEWNHLLHTDITGITRHFCIVLNLNLYKGYMSMALVSRPLF